jgi:hypothetical protein
MHPLPDHSAPSLHIIQMIMPTGGENGARRKNFISCDYIGFTPSAGEFHSSTQNRLLIWRGYAGASSPWKRSAR